METKYIKRSSKFYINLMENAIKAKPYGKIPKKINKMYKYKNGMKLDFEEENGIMHTSSNTIDAEKVLIFIE